VNRIGFWVVPAATSPPLAAPVAIVSERVELNFTTTPGSIVRVAPFWTVTLVVTMYGLQAAVHVSLAVIVAAL
jgi:hypothetical protein